MPPKKPNDRSISPTRSDPVLVGVLPMRLAVPTRQRRLPKSVADETHEHVAKQAMEWQQTAGQATFWELGAAAQGTEKDRTYALAGQVASTGEQLALAHAAAVEVALWREHRNELERDPAHEMSMRAMAEAQCLFVIGTGHALANVAVRALALDPKMRTELVKRFGSNNASPTFAAFSKEPVDWVSMNPTTGRKLRAVARSSGAPEVAQLIEPARSVGAGQRWRDLVGRRGEDFHRWRLQTHGIEGVPRTSPWTTDGVTQTLQLGHPAYKDAQDRAEQTAHLATKSMLDVAQAMQAFMEAWPTVSEHLGGPKFRLAQPADGESVSEEGGVPKR
jgi:hypothetical protein